MNHDDVSDIKAMRLREQRLKKEKNVMNHDDTAYVMITTLHKGVFAGYLHSRVAEPDASGRIRLIEARQAIYWSPDIRGVMGLAAHGPTEGCRIGPAVPSALYTDVTSVVTMTKEAQEAWESAPWKD